MSVTAHGMPLTRREIEAKITKRAWQDEAFRAEFLADPRGCFVKYAGAPAAQLPTIVVHDEEPGAWHIVLPAKPAGAGELSDEELEKIAGGTDVVISIVTMLVGSVAVSAVTAATATSIVYAVDHGW